MIFPGDEIQISPKLREGLAVEICQAIQDLEDDYTQLFNDIEVWWKWYEATPKTQGAKNFPFVGASNIVVPFIQIMADAFVNRAYASIFGRSERVWMTKTEREDQTRQVKDVGRWINWAAAGNDFNLRLVAYDQMHEMGVIGSSVLALNWREDIRWAYAPTGPGRKPRPMQVRFARGPLVEHVPREQILWDTNFLVGEAPMVVREFCLPWSELRNRSALDKSWNREAIEEIKGRGGSEGRSKQVRDSKREQDSRQAIRDERKEHDIREVHLEWPMLRAMGFEDSDLPTKPGDEGMSVPSPPIVATVDRKNRKLIRLIAEPYFFPQKPFFDIFYRKRSGRGHSVGIAKKLEHMQRGMTTTLNQAIDARTRANAVWAKTTQKRFLENPIDPSHPIYIPDMGSFEAFNLPTATFDDMRILTAIQVIGERQVGQSDPALGRETRQGGHPSPATSTLALLEQSDLMQGTTKELLRLQYSRLGEAIASLYQQFETNEDGKLQRVLGAADAARVEEFLFPTDPVSGTITFDVTALSGQANPDSEMKRSVLVAQMNQNYWLGVGRAVMLLENPQVGPMLKQVVLEGIKAQTQAHLRFLEAGDVDDLERYVLSLADNAQASAGDLQQAAGRAQEIARSRVAAADGSVGGAGGPPGGRTNGAAGTFGGL